MRSQDRTIQELIDALAIKKAQWSIGGTGRDRFAHVNACVRQTPTASLRTAFTQQHAQQRLTEDVRRLRPRHPLH
jgi:hypothetical protein